MFTSMLIPSPQGLPLAAGRRPGVAKAALATLALAFATQALAQQGTAAPTILYLKVGWSGNQRGMCIILRQMICNLKHTQSQQGN